MIRKILFVAAMALAVTAFDAGTASAQFSGSWHGPFGNQPRYPTLSTYLFSSHSRPMLPTYQAAPWYMYWPYDAHFLTPAPVNAPFNGPPVAGNFPVNPYFPAPAIQYGPMPGGPPPAGFPLPPGMPPPAGIPAPAGVPVPRQ
jgi:hypothetical protein